MVMIQPTPTNPRVPTFSGPKQPLAAADRDPQRDQAGAQDELDHLLAAEVGDVEDLLGGGKVGHLERLAGT
jgi:hypothetical protein